MPSPGDPTPPPDRWLVVRGDLLRRLVTDVEQAARSPRRSVLRDSIPQQPASSVVPPPEVLRAMAPLQPGGPWEGGTIDRYGRRWIHHPWQGWRLTAPSPYLTDRDRGRVYMSDGARRGRRRAQRARRQELLFRWARGPVLALAGVVMCAGVADMAVVWALAGLALAAVVLGMAWSVGRR